VARLFEILIRNFGEKRLTGALFLDGAKDFDTVWIHGLLYKLTFLNFPPYLVHKSHHTSEVERSERPSRPPMHLFLTCGLGGKGGLISRVPFSLYVKEIPFLFEDDCNEFCEMVQVFASVRRRKNVMSEVIYVVPIRS
jgi:hypothetical protein